MVHPLYWPGLYYFYPIGNTSAVCLTRDLSPEEDANILLLGCGDPRNIFHTIFCEPDIVSRSLDFTCNDMEPAVLARNVLLFSMVVDKESADAIWNIFFHMFLDDNSSSVLSEQCEKLIACSTSLQTWSASAYGGFIKMSTEYTLVEMRRHWALWLDMKNLPPARIAAIRDAFTSTMSRNLSPDECKLNFSSARSAGPLMAQALSIMSVQFMSYWRTGVTFLGEAEISSATLVNPTFIYSLAGEGCHIHHGTDPLVPFHLDSAFGNATSPLSVADVISAAKSELMGWCSGFNTALLSAKPPVIRFLLGDASTVCRVLHTYAIGGNAELDAPIGQWKAQPIRLNKGEYVDGHAPVSFNVIDTSNLVDHLGMLNVMSISAPLLSRLGGSGVLYTESLSVSEHDAITGFADSLRADLLTVGALIGLHPIDSISGFTTRCSIHEIITSRIINRDQLHQIIAWKRPFSADPATVQLGGLRPVTLDPLQLGTFFFNIYKTLFEQEDPATFWKINKRPSILNAHVNSNIIHSTRESFVLFLELIKDQLQLSEQIWINVMQAFSNLQVAGSPTFGDATSRYDLYAQLHRHGVYTEPWIHKRPPRTATFSAWDTIPSLIRVFLSVPRGRLNTHAERLSRLGTPPLHCYITGQKGHYVFSSVQAAFGKTSLNATKGLPRVEIEEDADGWAGKSSLVVSFVIPSCLLGVEPLENLKVGFSVRSTASTGVLVPTMGWGLIIFSAQFMDQTSVFIAPEPLADRQSRCKPLTATWMAASCGQIGGVGAVAIALDEKCVSMATVSLKLAVEDGYAKQLFQEGEIPQVGQTAPCVIELHIGYHCQELVFPVPVIGRQHKLRLARKSLYIEVVVPVSKLMTASGMAINPFPVIVDAKERLHLWNIHRLNLSRLSVLDTHATELGKWLNPHVGSMMSPRDKALKEKRVDDTLMYLKDTLHSIFVRSSGIQTGIQQRLFGLRNRATDLQDCDTLLFISDLKFDVQCHAVVCDGYVLPLTEELMSTITRPFWKLVAERAIFDISVYNGEMDGWKQLLPVLAERCRTSWEHGDKCEYKLHGKIPRSLEMSEDPLCSCGRGKETDGMIKVDLWKPFIPYVTRIALSPLFPVSYLKNISGRPKDCCSQCKEEGKPKLMACSRCKNVRYCSAACQANNWEIHKLACRP